MEDNIEAKVGLFSTIPKKMQLEKSVMYYYFVHICGAKNDSVDANGRCCYINFEEAASSLWLDVQ